MTTHEPRVMRVPGQLVLLAIATALLTATLQLTVMGVRRHLLGEFTWIWWSRDGIWFTPLAYLILFAPVALLLLVAHLLWPRRVTPAGVAGTLATLGAFSILLIFTKITWWAWLAVSIGVGVQVARLAARRPAAFVRGARWTGGTLGAAFVVLGVANDRQQRASEREALAALPAATPGAPNVLLLILDTVRARSLSLYGWPQSTTPRLEARAREGVVFDAAYSTAPWTLPSHASIFTGRYASRTSADWRSPLDSESTTLAEALRARGYATGGFVANFIATGYRTGLGRGFIRYQDVKRTFEEVARNSTLMQSIGVVRALDRWQHERWLGGAVRALMSLELQNPGNYLVHDTKTGPEVSGEFLQWQSSLAGDRPFFAFLNYFDAHLPYVSPEPYLGMFKASTDDHGHYLGAIRYLDDEIDRLLTELDRRGVLQNTIVVLTSDHGELFNENGYSRHGNSLYRNALHVPLVVLAPGRVPAATRVRHPVTLRDLAATILDLAGDAAVTPDAPLLPGQSMRPLMTAQATARDSAVVGELNRGTGSAADVSPEVLARREAVGDSKAVLDDTLHVVVNARGRVEAYAFRSDSMESQNLVSDSVSRAKYLEWALVRMRAAGARWKQRPGEPPPPMPSDRAGEATADSAVAATGTALDRSRSQ
jgi:arylsulfatase A-like enzyme